MNTTMTTTMKSGVMALLLMLGMALGAQAQTSKPIRVDLVNLRHQNLMPGGGPDLKAEIDAIWREMLPGEIEDVKKKIDPMVKKAISRGTRNETCRLTDHGDPDIQILSPTSFRLKYFIPNNQVNFYVTTPGPADRGLDPEFSIYFDLTLDIPIYLTINGLEARGATATPSNADLHTENATAKALGVADALIRIFLGDGPFNKAERQVNAATENITAKINKALKGVNDKIAEYVRQGYQSLKGLIDDAGMALPTNGLGSRLNAKVLHVVVARSNYSVRTGNATITGTVRWDKAYGLPAPTERVMNRISSPCDLLKIETLVLRDDTPYPAGTGFSLSNYDQVGRLASMEYVDNGSQYECRYTVNSLPHDIPVQVRIDTKANAKWSGVAANSLVSFAPVGWNGAITLKPRPKLNFNNTSTQPGQTGPQSPIIRNGRFGSSGASSQSTISPATGSTGGVSQTAQSSSGSTTQRSGSWAAQAMQKYQQAQQAQAAQSNPSTQKPQTAIEKAKEAAKEMNEKAANLVPALVTGRDFLMIVTVKPHF